MENLNKFGKLVRKPLKDYVSFRIGGVTNILFPKDEQNLCNAINYAKENKIKYIVLGRGTNILADDLDNDNLIILLKDCLNDINVDNNFIVAGAGASLREVAEIALNNNLTGFEALHGIPGSVGGGVIMNAGAYDGELKDVVDEVRLLTEDGIKVYKNSDMEFEYRNSIASKKGYIVLNTKFKLKKGKFEDIQTKMDDLWNRRVTKQPLEYPSAGSTFKRPDGYFAGKLIDDSNLRGLRHNGAMVSEKHCGFIINYDNATSKDVKELIETVQKVVFDKFNINLNREVKYLEELWR